MNETTKSDMIMITHRLKRLIGSFYHQKRIDIIITDNAHYVRNGGMWEQMRMTLTHNDFDSASIVNDSNGTNVTNLPVGDYSVYVSLPLSTSAGWLNLNIGGSSGITNLGPTVSEQLTGGAGYTRLNLATMLRVTQTNTKIRVFTNTNVSGTMREKGAMFITRLG